MPYPYFTRPPFEDRQVVQYSGTSITLSGETNINNSGLLIIKGPILDFTGTTLYTIAGVSGYVNSGEISSFMVEPPVILISGLTGTTTVDVTGYYLGGLDSGGTVTWLPLVPTPPFTGGTGSCITDLYVSNIHACSPLNINPLDEGSVYFGSTSAITIDVLNKKFGINTSNPNHTFEIFSNDNNTKFYYLEPLSDVQYVSFSGNSTMLAGVTVNTSLSSTGIDGGVVMGMVGENNPSYPGYGAPLDTFLYASANANRLNIINAPTFSVPANTDDIRFYAGQFPNSGFGSDMHINGSGADRGYIGIGTENPIQKLHISGNTRIENDLDGDTSLAVINNNNGGSSARAVIGARTIADSLGRTLNGVFVVTGYNTAIAGFGDGGSDYLKNALSITVAGNPPRGDINIGTRDTNKFRRFSSGNQDFSPNYLRGSLNGNGYWGFGTNLTGQTATVQIGDTINPATFKFVDGNQQNGYVLTSDASGNATWQASTGGGTGINPYYNLGSQSSSITWDVSGNSINYEVTLTGNTDLDLINVRNGDYGTLIVNQDSVGGRSILLNTVNGSTVTHKVVNGGGGALTLTATANATDIVTFTFNGSIMFWSVGNSYT